MFLKPAEMDSHQLSVSVMAISEQLSIGQFWLQLKLNVGVNCDYVCNPKNHFRSVYILYNAKPNISLHVWVKKPHKWNQLIKLTLNNDNDTKHSQWHDTSAGSQQQQPLYYGHYTGQPVLAGASS